jgi:hypothetical protein
VDTSQQESLWYFKKSGDRFFESVSLRFINMLQIRQGNLADGVATLQKALLLAHRLDSKYEVAAGLQHLGDAAQIEGNHPRAICLHWAARKVFDSIGAWSVEDNAKFEKEMVNYSAALDASVFAASVEEGRAMSMEEAVRFALDFPPDT